MSEASDKYSAKMRGLFFISGLVLSFVVYFSLFSIGVTNAQTSNQQQQNDIEFETGTLWVNTVQGRFEFTIELADTPERRSRGLMFRETMAENHGMLFDFDGERRIQMWMRNTPLSLDMIFIRRDGTVARIAERTTPFTDDVIDSSEPITHVLEVNAGISRLIGLKPDDRIELP